MAIICQIAGVISASAQSSATLAWNPNPESDVTGYRLHIGKRSGALDEIRTLGKTSSTVVTGLAPETTYFFALQAVNEAGLASALSAEISLTTAATPKPVIDIMDDGGKPMSGNSGSLDFGQVLLNQSSSTRRISVTNTGSALLDGISFGISGTNATDFRLPSVSNTSLASGQTTVIELSFQPSGSGNRSATLRILSNDPARNPCDIALTGTGVAMPEIAVIGPGGFDLKSGVSSTVFSSLDLAVSGETKLFTIRNEGSAPLNGIKAAIIGSHGTDFVAFASKTSLLAGESGLVSVTFRPSSPGPRAAVLQISSNDADENPFVISLLGNGATSPEIEITRDDGSALAADGENFGTIPIGGSGLITLRIHNRGTGVLDGINAAILGAHPQDFLISATSPGSLAPGASTKITLRFKPQAAVPRSAILRISSNDTDEDSIDIPLSGAGTSFPNIEIAGITPTADGSISIDFGKIPAGITGPKRSFTIKNTGNASLTGLTVALEGGQSSGFSVIQSVPPRLASGAVAMVRISFHPTSKGTRTATLIIRSNDAEEREIRISLTGTGLPAPRLEIRSISSGILRNGESVVNFGNGNNPRMASRVFTLTNRGSAPLAGIDVALSGLHERDFRLQKPARRLLRPGQSASLRVIFDPTRPGTRWAALRITSNDPAVDSFDIVLTGRASTPSSTRRTTSAQPAPPRLPFAKPSTASAPNPVISLMFIDGKRYLCITIPKTHGEGIHNKIVEVSGDLVEWVSGSNHLTVVADNAKLIKFRDKTPIPPGGKRHIRLRHRR